MTHAVVQGLLGVAILGFILSIWVRMGAAMAVLSTRDARMARMEAALAEVKARGVLNYDSGVRIEAAACVVAADLQDAHDRADATKGGDGAAADAGARSGPPDGA